MTLEKHACHIIISTFQLLYSYLRKYCTSRDVCTCQHVYTHIYIYCMHLCPGTCAQVGGRERRVLTEKHRKALHFEVFVPGRITIEINEKSIVLARYKN